MHKKIDNIINSYEKNPEAELEIKIYLPSINDFVAKVKELYDKNVSYMFVQTIDVIGKYRKESIYKNGEKVSHQYIDKKVISFFKGKKYKITLSHEHPIPDTKDIIQLIRLKNRLQIMTDDPNWRHDLTCVISLTGADLTKVRSYIQQYMSPIESIEQFCDLIPQKYDGYTKCEYEIEHIGDMESAKTIKEFIEPNNNVQDKAIFQICKLLHIRGTSLKDIISKPVQLNKNSYSKLIPYLTNYFLAIKADGERGLIYVDNESKLILIGKEYPIQLPDDFKGILDVEVIGDPANPDLILLFDILYYKKPLINEKYETRLGILHDVCKKWKTPFMIKKTVRLTDYLTQIPELLGENFIYPQDGLIFTENSIYKGDLYKWKPPEELTIDFLILKPDDKLMSDDNYKSRKGHTILFLYSGISLQQFTSLGKEQLPNAPKLGTKFYFPIHFSPSINPEAYIFYAKDSEVDKLNGHIAEMGYNYDTNELYVKNMRPDKDVLYKNNILFGNDYFTAESTYTSYTNPLTLDDLTTLQQGYFKTDKNVLYRPMIQFNSFVKAQVLRQLHSKKFIIDLAAGKGQDMFIYHGYKIEKVLFVDIDKDAIEELNSRKYDLVKKELHIYEWHPDLSMVVETMIQDITQMRAGDLPKADAIVINLALHYIVKDQNHINQFVNLIDSSLKKGGTFIFTCFDGQNIYNLLQDGEIILNQMNDGQSITKYNIKKLYGNDSFQPYGQQISVLHPFSEGEYYDEYLVNIDYIIQQFLRKKYIVLQNGSFADWIYKYERFDKKKYDRMNTIDKLYSSLYSYVSLVKQ